MEIIVTKENFKKEVLEAENTILVDFWATWCMPCKRQGVILEEMAAGGLTVGKVDVDEQPELAAQFRVMSIPTLIIFKGGKEVERLVGLRSREELEQILGQY
ncbi:MAG: thioredoxin [Lachnospiraceae bacterium]|nr:thioredoxin [Robinsoniella sp.]MDY3765087.1 thioredoxin [Lachnospiraceae bacterium]